MGKSGSTTGFEITVFLQEQGLAGSIGLWQTKMRECPVHDRLSDEAQVATLQQSENSNDCCEDDDNTNDLAFPVSQVWHLAYVLQEVVGQLSSLATCDWGRLCGVLTLNCRITIVRVIYS